MCIRDRRVAAILRSIWNLSANDNPYADWMLVQVSEKVDELRQGLQQVTADHEKVIEKEQARGLRVSILKSRAPVEVELGFRSPYGYMVVDLVLDFDYYTRVIKTMVQKNRLSDLDVYKRQPISSASVNRKMTSLRNGWPAPAAATTALSVSSTVAVHMAQSLAPLELETVSYTHLYFWNGYYSMRSRLARLWRAQSSWILSARRDVPPRA